MGGNRPLRQVTLVLGLAGFLAGCQRLEPADPTRPEWTQSGKEPDGVWYYALGQSATQPSAEAAHREAYANALARLAMEAQSRVNVADGHVSVQSAMTFEGARVIPNGEYTERTVGGYACWLLVSYSQTELSVEMERMRQRQAQLQASLERARKSASERRLLEARQRYEALLAQQDLTPPTRTQIQTELARVPAPSPIDRLRERLNGRTALACLDMASGQASPHGEALCTRLREHGLETGLLSAASSPEPGALCTQAQRLDAAYLLVLRLSTVRVRPMEAPDTELRRAKAGWELYTVADGVLRGGGLIEGGGPIMGAGFPATDPNAERLAAITVVNILVTKKLDAEVTWPPLVD